MSDTTADLQFDRAQFKATGQRTPCAACSQPLSRSYFEVNGVTVCATCCQKLRDQLEAGSSASRALRAIVAGTVAAVGGTILYYAILALTGYELGIIAIVVGFMVGKAVRWGSFGRGGWKYQTMAMVLTYLSIVGAYVPFIIKGFREGEAKKPAAAAPATAGQPAATTVAEREPEPTARQPRAIKLSFGQVLLGVGVLVLIACAAPFLAGIQNIMGLVIIAIGLYEAWKFNKRRVVTITGPHTLAATA